MVFPIASALTLSRQGGSFPRATTLKTSKEAKIKTMARGSFRIVFTLFLRAGKIASGKGIFTSFSLTLVKKPGQEQSDAGLIRKTKGCHSHAPSPARVRRGLLVLGRGVLISLSVNNLCKNRLTEWARRAKIIPFWIPGCSLFCKLGI